MSVRVVLTTDLNTKHVDTEAVGLTDGKAQRTA
jgi:hypothetical protein